ncbi:serine/threonine protein kinase [Glycomyces buryatensis]|uniref:non-specific serine/threonine protein kinase n=1 Tax=Glycomyces buryatensis TaxID=2570927 RepID=A0A4S8QBR4_9ACTN|nr:serine/threonine protein kinase [Glycomyces buryatensis]THV41720.1 serine/threonine protein kinase [Glycomyces buryatensis]
MESGTLIAGRYRLDRLIAWGGMGAVWRGYDTRLDREIGVKVLHRGLEVTQNPQDRFEQEAKTLASLKGPGFVEVYDYGDDRDGDLSMVYIVMEFVAGVSLAELLHSEERLSANRTMKIVAEAAEALAVAHGKGVVHRDIKPANLLVDADDHVRVIDFGISKLSNGAKLTSTDAVLGTASYVSPEQLKKIEVTGAADLYALGAVAYECLTGAPPFDSIEREVITHDHLWTPPPDLPDDVPRDVEAIVIRCLQKSPADRWGSGTELAEACRAAMRGEPSPWTHIPSLAAAGAQEPLTPESIPMPVSEPETPGFIQESAEKAAPTPPAGPPTRRQRRSDMWSWRFGFVAVAVVAILLLTTLFAWSPWSDPDDPLGLDDAATLQNTGQTEDGTETPADSGSESESAEESPSTEEGETSPGTDAQETGTDGNAGDSDGEPGGGGSSGSDEENADEPADTSGEVPRVIGKTTFDARDYLYSLGFTNVTPVQGMFFVEHDDVHCEVGEQSPAPGTNAEYSDEIVLEYNYEDEANGGGTSCVW